MSKRIANRASTAQTKGYQLSAKLRTPDLDAPPIIVLNAVCVRLFLGRKGSGRLTESMKKNTGGSTSIKTAGALYAVELQGSEKGSLWITAMPPGQSEACFAPRVTEMCLVILETIQKLLNEEPHT